MEQTAGRTSCRTLPALVALVSTLVAAAMVVVAAPAGAAAAPITVPVGAAAPIAAAPARTAAAAAAANCSVGESGAAVPTVSSGQAAVRTTIGVAKSMGVPIKGQIVAVMVMFQESSIRNLANDGTSTQNASWPVPGRDYWMNVTRLSLKYPHDRFGLRDGAHDTDSVGLYQQRPSYGWGNYGTSTGTTDPEGVIQRLLDPRWEAMAFFGGVKSAAPTSGLLDVPGWENMAPTYAANAVQGSNYPQLYAQWEGPATTYVNNNQDAPVVNLPWYPGGGGGALTCTSIPTDPAAGEAGRNPFGSLDSATLEGTNIRLTGWMIDPDAANGIGTVHFYDQGPFGTTGYPTGVANQPRPDVNAVYNVLGNYGFSTLIPWTGPGRHTICGYGINVGRGTTNPQIGCRDITVPGPTGWLDSVTATASGQIQLSGWAADPAAPGAREEVHIYVNGPNGSRGTTGTMTGDSRPDVAAALPWAGSKQGFHATVSNMGAGDNQVCVYAINVKPPQTNPLLGCSRVSVRPPPIGNLDAVSAVGGSAQVVGWTLDPNSPGTSIPVHIYVTSSNNQVAGFAFVADDGRPDVNAVIGVPGNHGFSRTVPLYPGANSVCAFGISIVSGDRNVLLGCRTVQATTLASIGRAEAPAPSAMSAAPTLGQAPSGAAVAGSTAPSDTVSPSKTPPAPMSRATTPRMTGPPSTMPPSTKPPVPTPRATATPPPTPVGAVPTAGGAGS